MDRTQSNIDAPTNTCSAVVSYRSMAHDGARFLDGSSAVVRYRSMAHDPCVVVSYRYMAHDGARFLAGSSVVVSYRSMAHDSLLVATDPWRTDPWRTTLQIYGAEVVRKKLMNGGRHEAMGVEKLESQTV